MTVNVTSGTLPFNFAWKKNGLAIPGATSPTFIIPFAQVADSASYSATVSNTAGSVTAYNTVSVSAAPANDSFANASTISSVSEAIKRGTNVSATKETGEYNHAGNAGGHSVWWTWKAPQSGLFTVDTIGTRFDTLLEVYTGSAVYSLMPVGADDDSGDAMYGSSRLAFLATAGTTYSIAVDGKNGATGDIVLQITNQSDLLPAYPISTLAGTAGSASTTDGTGAAARFHNPSGIAMDASGNFYVADRLNHSIRMITPGGVVTTLAGTSGTPGSSDGTGSAASFNNPTGVAVDAASNVYVTDTGNHTIRMIAPGGKVTTLAGTAGSLGTLDGVGSAARFNNPSGIAVDAFGNLYVADSGNYSIRMISPGGAVSTYAGFSGVPGSADGTGNAARFNNPTGVAVDGAGNVYVADYGNHTIRRIAPGAVVSTIAGSAGLIGTSDGLGAAARFYNPGGVAVDGAGNVYVADYGNHTIRFITTNGNVSTIAGSAGILGTLNGTGIAARFYNPRGLVVDSAGNIYVADYNNHTIRKSALVQSLPVIASLSGPSTGNVGDNVTLSASGSSWLGATLVWYQDGQKIPAYDPLHPNSHYSGATSASLTINNLVASDAGNYTLVATNSSGQVTSTVFTLVLTPGFTTQPQGQDIVIGSGPVTLNVVPNGSPASAPNYTYQWYQNNALQNSVKIPNATGSSYTITPVTPQSAGQYYVNVTNAAGTSQSKNANLLFTSFSADINGDGNSDLIFQDNLGDFSTWLLNNGAFLAGEYFPNYGLGPNWSLAGTGDFNADGSTDLVWYNATTGDYRVWFMQGTDSFLGGAVLNSPPGLNWSIAGIGDFNGDGYSDIVWQNSVTGEVTVNLMVGDAGAGSLLTLFTLDLPSGGPGLKIESVGDFNGDGYADVIWYSPGSGDRSMWLLQMPNYSIGFVGGSDFGTLQEADWANWSVVGTGDFNGDGDSDLVFQNTVTGEVTIWLMKGTTFSGGFNFGFVLGWTVVK